MLLTWIVFGKRLAATIAINHFRGAQNVMAASGKSRLQVAQKESRKRLVGDKALEKYALQFWGVTARVTILAAIADATCDIPFLISCVTTSIGNYFFGGTLNKQSCKPFLVRHATMDRLTRRMPAFSQAMHLPLSFDSHHAISTHADRCTMHLSFFEQPYPPQVMQRLGTNSDYNLYHRISRGINSSKIELVGHLTQATLI